MSLNNNIVLFNAQSKSPTQIEQAVSQQTLKLFQDRLFDASIPLDRRENWAAVVASLFGGQSDNSLAFDRLIHGTEDEQCISAISLGFAGHRQVLPLFLFYPPQYLRKLKRVLQYF